MSTSVSEGSKVQLHQYCRRCSSVLRSSRILKGSRKRNEEKLLIYDSDNAEYEAQKICHFCTHIQMACKVGLERLGESSLEAKQIWLNVTKAAEEVGRPPVRLSITCSTPGTQFVQELWASCEAGAEHNVYPLWNAPESIPDACVAYTSTSSNAHVALARRWLNECRVRHTECSRKKDARVLPGRLLCLIDSPEATIRLVVPQSDSIKYCVLSHRWGASAPTSRLMLSNIEQYKHTIAVDMLPKSFRDAIKISRSLAISHIWIDSLCIIQDSREDWECESRKMDSIFEGATCTIAAAGAEDSGQGCFADRNPLEQSKCRLMNTPWYISGRMGSTLDVQEATSITPLSERGWIFQERLLSPRTLSFGKRGIIWHCARGAATEQDPDGWSLLGDYSAYVDKIFGSNSPVGDWKPWPQGFTFQSKHYLESLMTRAWTNWNEKPDSRSAYCFHRDWMGIVQAYSNCKLTKSEDRLAALSGIVNRVGMYDHSVSPSYQPFSSYIVGAWKPTMLLDVLWYRQSSTLDQATFNTRFPFWSWASVNGRVGSIAHRDIPAETIIAALEHPIASFLGTEVVSDRRALIFKGALMPAHISSDRKLVYFTCFKQSHHMRCFIDWPRVTENACYFMPVFIEPEIWLGLLVVTTESMSTNRWRRVGVAVASGRNCNWVQEMRHEEIVII
ncbi:HET-domain-containing protein [Cucurbitaria berberidis CBS 394.84]|uniref:HET-domain-containing protein n=1 Tax=Cucurbitaria berberidis CBS 394.84 TaxID=1168544 RepID=A0A9P4GCR5_9PLEO|nr:HET-domain-containing protein [Cucurbitaria berberidis CBS 394.84]KAF1842951.1 HET-domain-containing protein [Cucurbitaria berberidis CBS 394.84]